MRRSASHLLYLRVIVLSLWYYCQYTLGVFACLCEELRAVQSRIFARGMVAKSARVKSAADLHFSR